MLESMVTGYPQRRDISVDKDVGRAGSGELSLRSDIHVGEAAETVGKREHAGVAPKR